jgi:SAM-dependent methyltransferase
MNCRICGNTPRLILDLGYQPLANALLETQDQQEHRYPLKFYFCSTCQYGMTDNISTANIFDDTYPYYSSINTSYVKQCREWAKDYRKKFNPQSVLEIGCNDGYMLENFKDLKHLGVEPSNGPAIEAIRKGIKVDHRFFTSGVDFGKYDLIIANNVLAHTPKLQDMAKGIAQSLTDKGVVVVEFPTLNNLIKNCQYDTIYHEHFSYFTLYSLGELFRQHGLTIQQFDFIPSHGGSIRAYFYKQIGSIGIQREELNLESFAQKVKLDKAISLSQIIYKMGHKNKLALVGAAAKGNTWLNYLGVSYDFFEFCVDDTPYKQGKYLPGSRIPIVCSDELYKRKPDILYILPWNFRKELMEKFSFIHDWGGEFACRGL